MRNFSNSTKSRKNRNKEYKIPTFQFLPCFFICTHNTYYLMALKLSFIRFLFTFVVSLPSTFLFSGVYTIELLYSIKVLSIPVVLDKAKLARVRTEWKEGANVKGNECVCTNEKRELLLLHVLFSN